MMSTLYEKAPEKYHQILGVIFLTIFVVQFGFLLFGYIQPSQLNTVTKVVKKDQLGEFPLLFQFCLRPGFNMTVLKSNGYTSMDNYFWGMNGTNKWNEWADTDIGWGGGNTSLAPEGLTSKIIPSSIDIFSDLLNESFMARPLSKYISWIMVATTTGDTVQLERGR